MLYRFNPSAGIAVTKVTCYSFMHTCPTVVLANKLVGSSSSLVCCHRVVMVGINDFSVQGFIIKDIKGAINI